MSKILELTDGEAAVLEELLAAYLPLLDNENFNSRLSVIGVLDLKQTHKKLVSLNRKREENGKEEN